MTPAQKSALALAAVEPIRYYKGGWYSTPGVLGPDQRNRLTGGGRLEQCVVTATLRALVTRGLLAWNLHDGSIYSHRWTITEAGRAEVMLAAAGL